MPSFQAYCLTVKSYFNNMSWILTLSLCIPVITFLATSTPLHPTNIYLCQLEDRSCSGEYERENTNHCCPKYYFKKYKTKCSIYHLRKSSLFLKKCFSIIKKRLLLLNLIPLCPPSGCQAGFQLVACWHWSWKLNVFCCHLPHSTNLRLYLKHYPALPKAVSTLVKRIGSLAQKQRRLTVDVLES